MTREELQRLYSECVSRAFRAEQLVGLVHGVESFLAEPDPTVEIAYLKAKLADVEAERDQAAVKALTARAEKAEAELIELRTWRNSIRASTGPDRYRCCSCCAEDHGTDDDITDKSRDPVQPMPGPNGRPCWGCRAGRAAGAGHACHPTIWGLLHGVDERRPPRPGRR